jgi:hypothetical protein
MASFGISDPPIRTWSPDDTPRKLSSLCLRKTWWPRSADFDLQVGTAAKIKNPVQDTVILHEPNRLKITRAKGLDADVAEDRTVRQIFLLK